MGAHSFCMDIPGCTGHPLCGTSAQLPAEDYEYLTVLAGRAMAGEASPVSELLSRFPDKVHFNAAREAIQVEGCDDTGIVAHIPLSPDQLRAAMATHSSMRLTE
jgi:hypothetical protein